MAVETCKFLEHAGSENKRDFITKTMRLLPLLYLKTTLVQPNELPDDEPERFVTENDYEQIRTLLADLLGSDDDYLDSFSPDMAFSETTLYATISEDLADTYQALKDFASCCQIGNDALSEDALAVCIDDFRNRWGTRMLGALRALHTVSFNLSDDDE